MTLDTETAPRATRRLLAAATLSLALAGCDAAAPQQEPPVAETPPTAPVATPEAPAATPPEVPPSVKPNESPAAADAAPAADRPPAPNPQRDAARAVLASDFATACAYLEFERFDPAVCEYFAKRATGQPATLSSRTLEAFLRSQNVARRSGTVVGWFEEPHSYEVRVNGQASILEVVDTRFRTTGRFTMWARRMDDEEMELNSGRVVNVPVFMEWPLADQMLDAMRARGDDAQRAATSLFVRLLADWSGDRYVPDEEVVRHVDEWPAFLAAWQAARATPPAATE